MTLVIWQEQEFSKFIHILQSFLLVTVMVAAVIVQFSVINNNDIQSLADQEQHQFQKSSVSSVALTSQAASGTHPASLNFKVSADLEKETKLPIILEKLVVKGKL